MVLLLIHIIALYQEREKNKQIPLLKEQIDRLETNLTQANEKIHQMSQNLSSKDIKEDNIKPAAYTEPKNPIDQPSVSNIKDNQNIKEEIIPKPEKEKIPEKKNLTPEVKKYTVQQQDHIWKIIRKEYQTDNREEIGKQIFDAILEYNPFLKGDPNRLKPGMILYLPDKKNVQENAQKKVKKSARCQLPSYYTVQNGDTLYDISRKYYKTHRKWLDILEANPDLKDEKLVYGICLKIP